MPIVLSRGKGQWPSASELELTPEQNSVGQCKEYFSVGRQKRLWKWTGSQASFKIGAPRSLLLQEQRCLCSCLLLLFPFLLMVSLMVLAPNARPGYLSLLKQNWAFTCATNHFKSLKGVLFNTSLRVVYDPSKTSFLVFLPGEYVRLVFPSPSAVLSCLPSQELRYFKSVGACHHVIFCEEKREGRNSFPLYCFSPDITGSLKAFTSC